MEEDDNNNIVQDDETHELIKDLFAWPDNDEDIDDNLDVPLSNKANKPLYEVSRENLLFATLFLVNLTIMNNLSNTCMTQILRYVICFITYT